MERIKLMSEQIANSPSVARTAQLFEDTWDRFRVGDSSRAQAFDRLADYNCASAAAVRDKLRRCPPGDDRKALQATAAYLDRLASRHEVIANTSL
ncbi:MAG TPA: hypothetical protein PKG71_04010 [Candidatus Woesebacteria bacterium]|nr:hypothetical protein [Candidatus Woesebacteria bacterium]HNS95104.1 hypothetical protein [Candidatus Woesebacteria bacterium]